MNDTNCSSNPTDEIEILKKYAEDFQERYPNLKVFNAVIHLDEETPTFTFNLCTSCRKLQTWNIKAKFSNSSI